MGTSEENARSAFNKLFITSVELREKLGLERQYVCRQILIGKIPKPYKPKLGAAMWLRNDKLVNKYIDEKKANIK